jgi:hypothetical protein
MMNENIPISPSHVLRAEYLRRKKRNDHDSVHSLGTNVRKIREFRVALAQELSQGETSEVFELNIQLIPLTIAPAQATMLELSNAGRTQSAPLASL